MENNTIFECNAQKLVGKFITHNEWAIKYFGDREDMSQEILLKVWETMPKFNPQRAKFSTFVCMVAKSSVHEKFRNSQCKFEEIENMEELSDKECLEDNILQKFIDEKCLKKAKLILQNESVLYYFNHKDQTEIGKMYGISQGAISRKIKKQTENFKKELQILL